MFSNFSSHLPLLPPWLDRSTLVNSDSDLDSGHCEASEVNSEIDSVMVPLFRVPLNDETCRRLNLVRSRSDASVVSTSNQLTSKEKLSLTRTMSNYETRLTVPSTNGHRESSGSPRLAHMKMTSYQQGDQLLNPGQLLPDVSVLTRKSDLSTGYRYYCGELIDFGQALPLTSTGRKYLFQWFLGERSSLWDNMDFWEYLLMDVVAAECDALGMN